MPIYVAIAVNVPFATGTFHYHLPPELEGQVQPGCLVRVPFGRQAVQGVVVGFTDQPEVSETRPVEDIIDPAAVVTRLQIELAQGMAHEWLAPLAACIGLMLPPGVEQQADQEYHLQSGPRLAKPTPTQARLLALLSERGPLRGQQIDRAMPRVNWRAAARVLTQKGLLASQPVLLAPRVRPKHNRTAVLAVSLEAAEAALPGLGRAGTPALERRQAILRYLMQASEPVDVAWVYAETGGTAADLKLLGERGLARLGEAEALRDPLRAANIRPYEAPPLTGGQQAVWQRVAAHLEQSQAGQSPPALLLHGVTGSGKTEIYLRAVEQTLLNGRQAIVMVPEIALTPQTIARFAGRFLGRFPGGVGVIHSGLSDGERYDTWRRARAGELSLVIGPRSALFSPLERLGLIVVDECHDDTYYQAEAAPYYHARQVAVQYAALAKAVCLLGSATPDVTSMYQTGAQVGAPADKPDGRGVLEYLHLPERILAHRDAVSQALAGLPGQPTRRGRARSSGFQPLEGLAQAAELPPVEIVDMRSELKDGNRSIFSRALQEALKQNLAQGLQSILFLNRRGTATYVFCRDCGYTLKCPRCEIPLTYHEAENILRCHSCAYTRRLPQTCPQCKGTRIRQFGTGTQKVEAEVQAAFPGVRTLRWDHETTRRKGAHQEILAQFAGHKADVLVGTQMLAKGLDLPLVTLVGVVLADVGLNLPDYRAAERTFQVLTQVAGRAGRSPLGGQVILQTFEPEHYVIQAAARHDYAAFYQQELAFRRQTDYPPFVRLARLEYRHYEAAKAEQAALALAARLRGWLAEGDHRRTRLIGPAPCFFGRVAGLYRWQIVVAGPDPAALLRGRDLGEWKVALDPPSLL